MNVMNLSAGLLATLLLSVAPAAEPSAAERLAVPDEAARQAADKQVREVFAEQLAGAKDRAALARELMLQGREPSNKPPVRYAALRLAQSVAADAGEVELASEVVDAIGKDFAVSAAAEQAALLGKFVTASRAEVRLAALAVARRQFEQSSTTDNYDESLTLGRLALELAKAARDKEAADQITTQGREVRRRQEMYVAVQAALDTLKADPADAASHLAAGTWIWFVKGDAEQGLAHLAKGSDRALAVASANDLAQPTEAAKKLAVADEWFRLASHLKAGRLSLLARAQHWYTQAAPQLSGLDKVRAEKWVADINLELQPVDTSPSPTSSEVTKPTDKPKHKWKPPAKNSQATFRTFLGVYMYWLDRKKMYPVVNLQVPARNLWTQEVQDSVRGRIPTFDEISYAGTAKIAVPADGVYALVAHNAKVAINGQDTGGTGDIKLRKGIHVVTYEIHTHGQPYITEAIIELKSKETGELVPFFNSWQDIQKFLGTPVLGQKVLEVSGWEPTEENELKLDPKTLKVVAPEP